MFPARAQFYFYVSASAAGQHGIVSHGIYGPCQLWATMCYSCSPARMSISPANPSRVIQCPPSGARSWNCARHWVKVGWRQGILPLAQTLCILPAAAAATRTRCQTSVPSLTGIGIVMACMDSGRPRAPGAATSCCLCPVFIYLTSMLTAETRSSCTVYLSVNIPTDNVGHWPHT